MRYYGEIFDYGKNKGKQGRGKGFGIIDNIDDCLLKEKEVIFYKGDLLCDSNELRAGALVSFEICPSNDNGIMAKKIGLLENDMDADLIERCFNSSYETVWMSVLKNYTKLVPVEKGLPKVREKLRSDLSFQEKDFSEHISPEYLAWSPALRKYTNPRTRLEVCVRLLNNPTSQDALKEKLIKELADTIEYSDKVESKIRDQIERKWFIKYKLQTSMVRPDELMEYLQNEYGDDDESNELLLRVLESNHYSQELVELVPRKKAIERIWDKLSDDVKLNYYRKHPKVERDIDELVLLLKYLPQYKKDIYMRCLGLDLISDDRLIPLLAPPEQVKQICLKSTLNNKLKNQLLLVLQENHYPKALLNQIPQKIFTEIIWEELPTAVKLDYYINNPSFERDADRLIAMLKTIPQSERLEYIESLGVKSIIVCKFLSVAITCIYDKVL